MSKKYLKEQKLAESLGWEIRQRHKFDRYGHSIFFYFSRQNSVIWHTGYNEGSLINNLWAISGDGYLNEKYCDNLENILLLED